MKKYLLELTPEQRQELTQMISTGKAAARELTHARILLKADQGQAGPGWSDRRIQEALGVSASTVQRVSTCCAHHGVQEAIVPSVVQRARRRRLDGTQEAYSLRAGVERPTRGGDALDGAVAGQPGGRIGLCGNDQPRDGTSGLADQRAQTLDQAAIVHSHPSRC